MTAYRPKLTPFDRFQMSTCMISEGNLSDAAHELGTAILQIDQTGVDAEMRADLVALKTSVDAASCAS